MLLPLDQLQHVNAITHDGKLLLFATDSRGKIWYSVKQDGFEDNALNQEMLVAGWENWQALDLPADESPDVSVVRKERSELTRQDDGETYLMRSRYHTTDESAVAPVQLVSGMGHLYVFRQSRAQAVKVAANSLLVDRFVLDGLTNKLVRKLEVRYKRSRQKHEPLQPARRGSGRTIVDSLDFRDTAGNPFFEPTCELSIVNNLAHGWFSVVLLPTAEQDRYRWHIFAYSNRNKRIELISVRASAEGLFDLRDETILEPLPEAPEVVRPRHAPGLIRRMLNIQDSDGNSLNIVNGFSATKYDVQVERETSVGPRLLRENTRVLLAVPTDDGNTAALSFAVALDGTLSQVGELAKPPVLLRDRARDVLLPLNTLDEVRAVGAVEPPQGAITAMRRSTDDRVELVSPDTGALKEGDLIQIRETNDYNGHFQIGDVQEDSFTIQSAFAGEQLGSWELVPAAETNLLFDGIITGFVQAPDGSLIVEAPNHGLVQGDAVQIVETEALAGRFPVTSLDRDSFQINHKWQPGEAVNLRLISRRRRGLLFDGNEDYVATPPLELTKPLASIAFGQTYSAWVWPSARAAAADQKGGQSIIAQQDGAIQLVVDDGRATLHVQTTDGPVAVADDNALPVEEWTHLAATLDHDPATSTLTIMLCRNGQEIARQQVADAAIVFNDWTAECVIGQGFAGKIAEVRIWDTARSPQAIRDSMYLRLTGREVNLVGYYRLGALVEEHVVDFSVFGNDGTVHGDPFVSAVTLARTLRDGTTPAVRYSNEELFAVTQRATYLERFEFYADGITNPEDVDGAGTPIFALSYWGKRSRRSEARVFIASDKAVFEELENGWFSVSARFTVPDDVNLARVFEISDVAGDWATLEVRKHSVRLISDAITQATFEDVLPLQMLADPYQTVDDDLRNLAAQEHEEATLLLEKRTLEADIRQLEADAEATRRLLAEAQKRETQLRGEVEAYRRKYHDLSSSWYTIQVEGFPNLFLTAGPEHGGPKVPVSLQPLTGGIHQHWRFVTLADGTPRIYCRQAPNAQGRMLTVAQDASGEVFLSSPRNLSQTTYPQEYLGNEQLVLQPINNADLFRIVELPSGTPLRFYPMGGGVSSGRVGSFTLPVVQIRLLQRAWAIDIGVDRSAELEETRAEIKRLRAFLEGDRATMLAQKQARLAVVLARLAELQLAIAQLNTHILQVYRTFEQEPLVMKPLHVDGRGLLTAGARLGFARTQGRIQALETSEGNVQLSYFDSEKRMRQTNFDATADRQNATFEQWRPDGPRAGLNFARTDSLLRLEGTVEGADGDQETVPTPAHLGDAWTVEGWFSWPLPETEEWNSLVRTANGDSPLLVRQTNQLTAKPRYELGASYQAQGEQESSFLGSGFDLMLALPVGWHHVAAVGRGTGEDATTTFFVNGKEVGQVPANISMDVAVIGNRAEGGEPFGRVAEVRAWRIALSAAEVAINSKVRLTGAEPGLVGYWPMSEAEDNLVRNHVGTGHDGTAMRAEWCACSAPVGRLYAAGLDSAELKADAVVSAEYSTVYIDPVNKRKAAMMRRFFAVPASDGLNILPDQRVEELELQWIGNTQFAPTLLGYIEGAPPVPSENLTVDGSLNYNGATSVALTSSDDVSYSWSRGQEAGLGANLDLFVGVSEELRIGFIATKKMLSTKAGFVGNLGFSYGFLNSSIVAASSQSNTQNRLDLRGAPEPGTKFPHIGRRFVPKNVGYALVTSGLADVFITRLKRSGKMIGYQVRPNEDVPIDVNTITFLINPAYTMNGSLDGQTGHMATSDRFFRHVPEMRAQYGSMYPASYYRLQEAYDLKAQIENADKQRESYFVNFNSRLVDETSLNREVDKHGFDQPDVSLPSTGELTGPSREGSDDGEDDQEKLDRITADLAEDRARLQAESAARQREIEEKVTDQEQRVQASAALDGWQRKMEILQIRAGKRNIANTYVWDGDGGWRAETQQFMNTIEHTVGASFNFSASLGAVVNTDILIAGLELTAAATVDLTQTMTKTERRSRGFGLDVDMSGVEHVGITDFNDNPLIPGEKVDRYRFMSFYLEGSNRNFDDFFNYVVDPEWLASNDEEARALRQTRNGKSNKAWRVLHRVTYVERPALIDFGHETRPQLDVDKRPWWYPSIGGVLERVEALQAHNAELEAKLNEVLSLLRKSK